MDSSKIQFIEENHTSKWVNVGKVKNSIAEISTFGNSGKNARSLDNKNEISSPNIHIYKYKIATRVAELCLKIAK